MKKRFLLLFFVSTMLYNCSAMLYLGAGCCIGALCCSPVETEQELEDKKDGEPDDDEKNII